MAFAKATREKVHVKVLLTAPSGGGKSYSALRIATGLAKKCGSRIAYIGTEGSRDKYYANEFDYDLMQLEEGEYSVQNYIDAIDDAIDAGYKVLIIDSVSPEWDWLNDQNSKMNGNSFQNWGKLKPKHKLFEDKILLSDIHIIACARGKAEWVMEDKDGKKVPKKVGLGANQDKQISFNYTVSFQLEQGTHFATADKDNTHLFEDRIDVLTEKDGEALYEWANNGKAPAPKPKKPKIDTEKNEELAESIKKSFMALEDKDKKAEFKALMKECGIANFKDVASVPTENLEKLAAFFAA